MISNHSRHSHSAPPPQRSPGGMRSPQSHSPAVSEGRTSPHKRVTLAANPRSPHPGKGKVEEEIPESPTLLCQMDSSSTFMTNTTTSSASSGFQDSVFQRVKDTKVYDQTGRKLDAEQLVKQIVEQISDAIRHLAPAAIMMVDTEGLVFDMNPKAEDMFGVVAADIVNKKNISHFMASAAAKRHDSFMSGYMGKYENTGKAPKSVINSKLGRELLAIRYHNNRPSEFNVKLQVRGVPHPAGKHLPPLFFIAYIEDVSEAQKLREATEINAFIREKGDDALIVMTDYGKILDFNDSAADLFRYNRRFIIGQNIKKLMPPNIAEVHDEKLAMYRERCQSGMVHTSPVVGKIRQLKGYRPKFDSEGCEEFDLELRVEGFSGGKVLVAFVADIEQKNASQFNAQTTLDLFPKHTHDRLVRGETVWDEQSNVTVMFCDVAKFSQMSQHMTAEEVFKFINDMVTAFDEIGYRMEKIKTIGNCYMAFFEDAEDALLSGLRMIQWAKTHHFDLRVGLHTGVAVSGVIGTKRRTFDMWGDTVNTGKRMEEQGVPGQVQISIETFESLKSETLRELFLEHRAMVKGKGYFDTFMTSLEDGTLPPEVEQLLEQKDIMERGRRESVTET